MDYQELEDFVNNYLVPIYRSDINNIDDGFFPPKWLVKKYEHEKTMKYVKIIGGSIMLGLVTWGIGGIIGGSAATITSGLASFGFGGMVGGVMTIGGLTFGGGALLTSALYSTTELRPIYYESHHKKLYTNKIMLEDYKFYKGKFKGYKPHGKGKFYDPLTHRRVLKGSFKNGMLINGHVYNFKGNRAQIYYEWIDKTHISIRSLTTEGPEITIEGPEITTEEGILTMPVMLENIRSFIREHEI